MITNMVIKSAWNAAMMELASSAYLRFLASRGVIDNAEAGQEQRQHRQLEDKAEHEYQTKAKIY